MWARSRRLELVERSGSQVGRSAGPGLDADEGLEAIIRRPLSDLRYFDNAAARVDELMLT
jgi:hypothetical protein